MFDNHRLKLEKLLIGNVNGQYPRNTINRDSRRMLKINNWLGFYLLVICIASSACKDEKSKPNQSQSNVKEVVLSVGKKMTDHKVILFYGNSLTAGYKIE